MDFNWTLEFPPIIYKNDINYTISCVITFKRRAQNIFACSSAAFHHSRKKFHSFSMVFIFGAKKPITKLTPGFFTSWPFYQTCHMQTGSITLKTPSARVIVLTYKVSIKHNNEHKLQNVYSHSNPKLGSTYNKDYSSSLSVMKLG